MRLIEYKGKKAEISEGDWKTLMKRFNPEGMPETGRWVNCPLCSRALGCVRCPLRVFAEGSIRAGCVVLIQAVIGTRVGVLYKRWIRPSEVHGIENIRKIYEAIANLPKVQFPAV